MLRNSTEKFKQVYRSSSNKKLEGSQGSREPSRVTEVSLQLKSYCGVKKSRSVPKLENSNRMMARTQPVISINKYKSKDTDRQYTIHTSNQTELQTIQTVMRRRGVEDQEIQQLKEGKLKKTSRTKLMVRDSQDFIENLPKNSLFFCCQCYQYVFEIQKRRHFPDCKDLVNTASPDIAQIGLSRLKKLVQLARYSETTPDQINDLYTKFNRGQHKRLMDLHYPKFDYFTLKEISFAFAYIYNSLLRGVDLKGDSTLFTCF